MSKAKKATTLAQFLASPPSYTQAILCNQKITDADCIKIANVLKNNKTLIYLHLDNNQIGDLGAAVIGQGLSSNKKLQYLHLSYNQIGDAGAAAIGQGLSSNKTLIELYLYLNQIGDAGAAAIGQGLSSNKTLTQLCLSYNRIGDLGAIALKQAGSRSGSNLDVMIENQADSSIGSFKKKLDFDLLMTAFNSDFRTLEQWIANPNIDMRRTDSHGRTVLWHAAFLGREEVVDMLIKAGVQHGKIDKVTDNAKSTIEAAQFYPKIVDMLKVAESNEILHAYDATVNTGKIRLLAGGGAKYSDNANNKGKYISKDVEAEKIIELSNLIREGNDRLQVKAEHAILLLGNTGAGKSTLAHIFAGRKLQAIENEVTGDLILDAVEVLPHIAIGLGNKSETTVPNRCLAKDNKTIIWDCSGFNDTDVAQDIANSFYIRKLFEITTNAKFVLVIPEETFRIDRGTKFLDTVKQFMNGFSNINDIEGALSIVISQVKPRKNIDHIKGAINKLLTENKTVTPEVKLLVEKVMDKSLHIFHQPTDEGVFDYPDIFSDITASTAFIEAKADMANMEVSERAREYSSELLSTVKNNFDNIANVMASAIADATNANVYDEDNVLIQNEKLISNWLPKDAKNWNVSNNVKQGYFLKQQQLSSMKDVLENATTDNIDQCLDVMQQLFDVIQDFVNPADHNHLLPMRQYISEYPYVLKQQYEYIKFFRGICKIDVPSHQAFAKMINVCKGKVSENLEYQVKTMQLDDSDNAEYYKEAIKYLDMYPDSKVCKDLKASAYVKLGDLADTPKQTIEYYVEAIKANKQLHDTYEKLGDLYSKEGDYEHAIKCYKVVNNNFRIKQNFKKWLDVEPENPDIMMMRADHLVSIGAFGKAVIYYNYAAGLTQDQDARSYALMNISKIVDGYGIHLNMTPRFDLISIGHQDYYNFDLVNEEFFVDLMG